MEDYKFIEIKRRSPNSHVFYINLNRPSRANALSGDFFTEFPLALSSLDHNPEAAVIILAGSGKHFCAGIDLQEFNSTLSLNQSTDSGRASEKLRREIKLKQRAVTAIEECRKPVIAAIHGGCIGGGIDVITACDIRYCTENTVFSVKEVDLALAADLGSLQRLPAIVGFGAAMELALTGRNFTGSEAKKLGLVTQVFGTKEEMKQSVEAIAEDIASKSPLAVVGTKRVLIQSRDLTVDQALDYVATWNSSALRSEDLKEAIEAHLQKRKALFAKL